MRIDAWLSETRHTGWWARALSFAAVIGLLLGLIGPFGSYLNDGVAMRLLYWCGITVAAMAIAGALLPPLIRLGIRLRLPWPVALAVALALADLPVTALSAVIVRHLWSWQTARLGPSDFYAQTLLMSACVLALWLLLERTRHAMLPPAQPPPPEPPRRSVTPAEPVLSLRMEDHYVRVHRASGSTLELMPMHEAIRRFGAADGLQVHRSWWVAAAAVAGAERDVRNWRLRLTDGTTVPVARNRVAELRARGWIDDPTPAAATPPAPTPATHTPPGPVWPPRA